MAENDIQRHCILDTEFALRQYFAGSPNVYVSADLLVYYREGDPYKSVAPDVLVAFDVKNRLRRSYKRWEEGKAPDVVFEFASAGTWQDDLDWKMGLYQGIGVREYFLFDPAGEFFQPPFQGFRLKDGAFSALPVLIGQKRGEIGLKSERLGLELWARHNENELMPYVLRFYDPAGKAWLLTPAETEAARQAEANARQIAEARAQAAEEESARLKVEMARLKGD